MTANGFLPLGGAVDLDDRRARVIAAGIVNGIDFIEVRDGRTLLVRLLSKDRVPRFDPDTVKITREGTTQQLPVIAVCRPVDDPAAFAAALGFDDPVVAATALGLDEPVVAATALGLDDPAAVLAVVAARVGDQAPYRLHLLAPSGTEPPEGFDPVLCEMPFSFHPDTAADPRPAPSDDAPQPTVSPLTDYLARDAQALRTRLLDRFAALVPGWNDRNPADPAVVMLELFAALGDRLAYWQDAVASEAFLGTARRRESVRRHARLLDYDLGEGCAARVWLTFATRRPRELAAGTPVTDLALPPGSTGDEAVAGGGVVFETCGKRTVTPERNALELYAWGDPEHVLPAGSQSAFLLLPPDTPDPALHSGDVLVLVGLAPEDGVANAPTLFGRALDGDPTLRFAVRLDANPVRRFDPLAGRRVCPKGFPRGIPEGRAVLEIHWAAEDALPRALPVTARGPGGTPVTCAAALANVVPADEGATLPAEPLLPPTPTPGVPFRPRLRSGAPAWTDPTWSSDRPANLQQRPDPTLAVAALRLSDGRRDWSARRDLLGSGRQDPHLVVEPDGRGGATLRFGDGIHGRIPDSQVPMAAEYRVGGGTRGNVAAGTLVTMLSRPDRDGRSDPTDGGPQAVWNPLPAAGGTDPEDIERARRLAAAGLRHQERAVTSGDYATVAAGTDGVQRSAARRRWTGSWYVQQVTVDPLGAEDLSPDLAQRVRDRLEQRRAAGTDVAVAAPAYAALGIALTVHVRPGYARLAVEARVRDAVSARRGFFHPDRLTFGQAVYLSDLVVTVADVPGVEQVKVTRFARSTDSAAAAPTSLETAVIPIRPLEVARCDSDPDRPDRGWVELTMEGGT